MALENLTVASAFRPSRPAEVGASAPSEVPLLLPTLSDSVNADVQALLARVIHEETAPTQSRQAVCRALGGRISRLWFGRTDVKSPGEAGLAPPESGCVATKRASRHRLHRPNWGTRFVGLLSRPFVFIAQVFLVDVSFRRDGNALHIVLARKSRAALRSARVPKAIAEAEPLRMALKQLLDLHPLTRRVKRHLGYFESMLASQGLTAMKTIPIEVLGAALEQLDSIVTNWSDRQLADLRSRMAVAIKGRSQDAFFGEGGQANFMSPSRLLVDDVSHSEFLELERQYQGLIPQDTIQSALSAAMLLDVEEPVTCALYAETDQPHHSAADASRLATVNRFG